MTKQVTHNIKPHNLLLILALMTGEWILLVAGVKRNEMIVGFGAVLLAFAFLCLVLRAQDIDLDFKLRDISAIWRVPWYILANTLTLCSVLAKDILGIERAGSFYSVSGFTTSKTDPTLVARRVLATAYTTISPNSIVIGIDYEQSRLLLHQVKRDEVSKID